MQSTSDNLWAVWSGGRWSLKELNLITGNNDGTHDFGYNCCLPENITLEDLVIDDSVVKNENYAGPMIFGTFGRDVSKPGLLPYKAEGQIFLNHVTVTSGKPLGLSENEEMFSQYKIEKSSFWSTSLDTISQKIM